MGPVADDVKGQQVTGVAMLVLVVVQNVMPAVRETCEVEAHNFDTLKFNVSIRSRSKM